MPRKKASAQQVVKNIQGEEESTRACSGRGAPNDKLNTCTYAIGGVGFLATSRTKTLFIFFRGTAPVHSGQSSRHVCMYVVRTYVLLNSGNNSGRVLFVLTD